MPSPQPPDPSPEGAGSARHSNQPPDSSPVTDLNSAWQALARSAKTAYALRNFDTATSTALQAYSFARQHFDLGDPRVLNSCLMAAESSREGGKLSKALEYYQEYLTLKLKHSQPDEELASVYADIAQVHLNNADATSAVEALQKSLDTVMTIGLGNKPIYFHIGFSLSVALERAGNNEAADKLREELFEQLERAGLPSTDLYRLWSSLAGILVSHHYYDRALSVYDNAHDLLEEIEGAPALELSAISTRMAEILCWQGNRKQCQKYLARAEQELAADSSESANIARVRLKFTQAELLQALGVPKREVEEALEAAFAAEMFLIEADEAFTRECKFRGIELLKGIGEIKRAKSLLERINPPAADGWGPQVVRYWSIQGELAQSSSEWDKATQHFSRALELAQAEWTPELQPFQIAQCMFNLAGALMRQDPTRSLHLLNEVEHLLRPSHVGSETTALGHCLLQQARLLGFEGRSPEEQRAKLEAALRILDQPEREVPLRGLLQTLTALCKLEFESADYQAAVKYGERALGYALSAEQTPVSEKIHLMSLLADAYTFLGNSGKAAGFRATLEITPDPESDDGSEFA
ncbi:MAG: hypothetical protein K1X79_03390 [Oligoflexia bacterium]|nr:hypothetical protein [Oligoflexia bacterium]